MLSLVVHLAAVLVVGPRPGGAGWLLLGLGPLLAWGLVRPLLGWAGPRGTGLLFAGFGVWLAFCAGHRLFLGAYPDHGTLEFTLSEPSYAWTLVKDRLTLTTLLGLGTAAAAGWFATWKLDAPGAPSRRSRWAGILAALAALALVDARGLALVGAAPEATTLLMLGQTRGRRIGAGGLRRALGRQVPPPGPPPPFHVLMLVHESLGPLALDPEVAPFLAEAVRRGDLLTFDRAYAPASMTDVALPSLFSGVDPVQPSQLYHRVPLVWHRAQAAGMRTGLFSVQRFNYYGFPDFLLADGLNAWETADHAGLPLVNDTGADDGWLVDQARAWFRRNAGHPTFTVLHFNATHAPGLERPEHRAWTADRVAARWAWVHPARRAALARYLNACAYLDAVQARIFEVLKQEGLLERTWIIATADHGEAWEGPPAGRMDDLRPAALQVPLWMRLPVGFPVAWRSALEANQHRLVGNLDLAPTLAEALGQRPAVFPGTLGASLLGGLGPDRVLIAHNSGEVRKRDPEALSLLVEEGTGLRQVRWHPAKGLQVVQPEGLREEVLPPDTALVGRVDSALNAAGPGGPNQALRRRLIR